LFCGWWNPPTGVGVKQRNPRPAHVPVAPEKMKSDQIGWGAG
jgi:hypothetical protein